MPKILLIDNDTYVHQNVSVRLEEYRAHFTFDVIPLYTPQDVKDFVRHRDSLAQEIALVLLDIYWREGDEPGHPYGLDLLPVIRSAAPWLPVIAFTSYCDLPNIADLSERGFDGILPKKYFSGQQFSADRFMSLLTNARNRRVKSARSDEWSSHSGRPPNGPMEVEKDFAVSAVMEADEWLQIDDLLPELFPKARSVNVASLRSGFSGAHVFRVTTETPDSRFVKSAHWIVKLDSDPARLFRELIAHESVRKSGVHHASYPPLLHPGLIVKGQCAGIVYQCEDDSRTLADALRDESVEVMTRRLSNLQSILTDLYGNSAVRGRFPRTVWFDADCCERFLSSYAGLIEDLGWNESDLNQLRADIEPVVEMVRHASGTSDSKQNHWLLDVEVIMDMRRIHGDLHASNILTWTSDRVVLIDFALAHEGPMASDCGKLETDVLLNLVGDRTFDSYEHILEQARVGLYPAESDKGSSTSTKLINQVRNLFAAISTITTPDVLDMAALHYCLKFAGYEKTPPSAKVFCIVRAGQLLNNLRVDAT